MKQFFKSKINITLFSIQSLAFLFLCFCSLHGIFVILAIVLEGVFFIVYGVSFFLQNKNVNKETDIYNMMPISDEEKKSLSQRNLKSKKFNKLKGLMFIAFGIILIFLIII